MNISVKFEKPQDGQLAASITIDKADVDAAIKNTYREIATRYNFQGFRRGHVPPQVINGMIGREAVLAEATGDLVEQAMPLTYDELDIVPLADPDFGEDAPLAEEGKDLEVTANIKVAPEAKLKAYDAVEIEMPPAEVTDAEVDEQVATLMGYHTTYEDIKSKRMVRKDDIVSINVENIENAESFAGENRMLDMSGDGMPAEFDKQIVGMHKGDEREVEWTAPDAEGNDVVHKVKVTLNSIKEPVTPELDDEFAKNRFGFDTVDEFRDAVADEVKTDKDAMLPNIKEERICAAVADQLDIDELPEEYVGSVFNELVQNFLTQLQRRGMTLDGYLAQMGIAADKFIADTQENARERARQSLALDAVALHEGFEATKEDIEKEFADAGFAADEIADAIENFRTQGRLAAIREGIRRGKALDFLTENAKVTEVDEAAKRAEEKSAKAEKKTTKKAAKSTKKDAKAEEKADEKAAEPEAKADEAAEKATDSE